MEVPKYRRILFIHIQRTGGTSIQNLLHTFKSPYQEIISGHKTYLQYQEEGLAVQDYFTLSIVRNPWDRVVSFYKFLLKQRGEMEVKDYSFEEFLNDQLLQYRNEKLNCRSLSSGHQGI